MADAHRRRFDAVLVWKIDRFGRSLKHLVNAIADLGAYGVAFVSLNHRKIKTLVTNCADQQHCTELHSTVEGAEGADKAESFYWDSTRHSEERSAESRSCDYRGYQVGGPNRSRA